MLLCGHCFAQGVSDCPKILEYVNKKLPHCGVLKMSKDFVYVDVDDAYIHKLIGFIEKEGFEEPPYFENPRLVGAHISVMYNNETKEYGVTDIEECGEVIFFTPKECKIVHPPNWKEVDEVYFIVVDAPELNRIREKYGLPKGYDFHITIGVKPKMAKSA